MKKLLILNGSHSEISLIKAAKEMGYYVITTGNAPDGIGHEQADCYIPGDYSDKEKMMEIAVKENISAVVSCANDFGAISAAYIAEKLKLSGHDSYDVAELLHRKDKFKVFARKNCLQMPISEVFNDEIVALEYKMRAEYPLIVKPADLTGGKGCSRVNNSSEYDDAIYKAFDMSRVKKIVVERFIEGTYHSFSTFLVDQKVIAYYTDNEYSNVFPFFVDTSAGPASHENDAKDILIGQAEKIAHILHLADGVFHMQYVLDKEHVPYIIDVTRRCSGDLYPEPVEHSTGIPWSKWIVQTEAGLKISKEDISQIKQTLCGRHCIMADKNGILQSISISPDLDKHIYKKIIWMKPGERITNYKIEKCGIVFYEFYDRDDMLRKVTKIKDLVRVEIKNECE